MTYSIAARLRQHRESDEPSSKEAYRIPNFKVGLVIGRKGSNLRRIERESGASLKIDDIGGEKYVAISGTSSQRARAQELVKQTINKPTRSLHPDMGFLILDLPADNRHRGALHLLEFNGKDVNPHSRETKLYAVRHGSTPTSNPEDEYGLSDLTRAMGSLSVSTQPRMHGFTTSKHLNYCFSELASTFLKMRSDETANLGSHVRLAVFFGSALFAHLDPLSVNSIDGWCSLSRTRDHFFTSFQHHAPGLRTELSTIKKRFNLKEKTITNENKISVSMYYDQGLDRRRLKLRWDSEKGEWCIRSVVTKLKRAVLVDMISGSDVPDVRFLIKTQDDITEVGKHRNLVNILQRKKEPIMSEKMWLRPSDFAGMLQGCSVRQVLKKERYENDEFQLTLLKILQDSGHGVFEEEMSVVKHLKWKAVQRGEMTLDQIQLDKTMKQTAEFAKEIAKIAA